MTHAERKPRWWLWLMFLLSLLYLLVELIFNAQLVRTAGSRVLSEEALRHAELFGRTVSGVGAVLLVADLLLRGPLLQSKRYALAACAMAFMLVWPLVFFGQKWLVDELLIEPSSAEQRQRAVFSQTLKRALTGNAVAIAELPFDPDSALGPSERTFLALFGAMVYGDGTLLGTIETHKREIATELARAQAMREFDGHYARYKELRGRIRGAYRNYVAQSRRYNTEHAKVPQYVAEERLHVEQDVKEGYARYRKQRSAFEARMEARAQELAPFMWSHFERRKRCNTQSCYSSIEQRYDRQLGRLKIKATPADYWLIVEDVSTAQNLTNTVVAAALSGGVTLLAQGADKATGGDGGWKDKRYRYTNDVDHYRRRLIELHREDFAREARGLPYGIENIAEFRLNSATSALLREEAGKRGVRLPADWTLADRAGFEQEVGAAVRARIEREWREGARAEGLDLPPNLSWGRFQRQDAVQARIRAEMGEYYVSPMLADWNNVEFQRRVIEPNVRREVVRALEVAAASAPEFADGGAYAELGKSALRATIVPPISMGLSLFLSLLTLLKFPSKLTELLRNPQQSRPEPSTRRRWLRAAGPIGFVLALVVVPLSIETSIYAGKDTAVAKLLAKVEENAAPHWGFALRWVLHTQPLISPLGDGLERGLGVYAGFGHMAPLFGAIEGWGEWLLASDASWSDGVDPNDPAAWSNF